MGLRQMAVIVFTDAVDSTRLLGAFGHRATEALQADLAQLAAPVEFFGGMVIKSTGDGLLLRFQSASSAVNYAIEAQEILRKRPREAGPRFEHRIGIHVGEVEIGEGGDLFGPAVHEASRIQGEASPGAICFSQPIKDQLDLPKHIRVFALGERQLKGVGFGKHLYQIGKPPEVKAVKVVTPRYRRPRAIRYLAIGVVGILVIGLGTGTLMRFRPALAGLFQSILPPAGPEKPQTKATGALPGKDVLDLKPNPRPVRPRPDNDGNGTGGRPPKPRPEPKVSEDFVPEYIRLSRDNDYYPNRSFADYAAYVRSTSEYAAGMKLVKAEADRADDLANFMLWLDEAIKKIPQEEPLVLTDAGGLVRKFYTAFEAFYYEDESGAEAATDLASLSHRDVARIAAVCIDRYAEDKANRRRQLKLLQHECP